MLPCMVHVTIVLPEHADGSFGLVKPSRTYATPETRAESAYFKKRLLVRCECPSYELSPPEANQILGQAARDEFLVEYHGSWTGTRAP